MMAARFIPLACHSVYSLLWGTASPEALCRRATEAGMSALALTDREGLYGILPFWNTAREAGLHPILGARIPDPNGPARLLAADANGYRRLARILTLFHRQKGRKPGFSLLDALREDRQGLMVVSTSLPFLESLARDSGQEGLYIALYPYGPQRERIRFSRRSAIPLAAVAPVYFLDAADYSFHRLLRAIGLSTKLDRLPARELAPPWAWFQSSEQWRQRYLHCPEALRGMFEIAERCRMERPPWGERVFPSFQGLSAGEAFVLLEKKSRQGALQRYGAFTQPLRERLGYELDIIRSKSLASYFLVVEDIVHRFPITCGRGSAAASLVSYCLGITHVDPLKHNLFFERFLNPGRTDPPDIDVDFPWDERDAVLAYVLEKYGPEHCAMVANHVGFRIRAALRETAKVHGIPDEEIQNISHGFSHLGDPFRPSLGQERVARHPAYKNGLLDPPWPAILQGARRLEGMPRHLSVHCGGVVITPDPLPERVPVEQARKGVPVIQWEKDITEAAGLVKIDLLGNRSLAVIRDALKSIRANGGPTLSYGELNPLEDRKTCEMLARGDTVGVFYVESPAMRQLLKKTGKGDYAHLVVQSSIIRPAANEFIREYVRRVHGGSYVPLHPLLEEILKETHGILCYQEDVSRVAMVLAGFDAVQADLLRKVLSKKHRHARLADFRDRFSAGARSRGVSHEVTEEVWRMILSFQGYSFCKPHSASYALVSFKSCYLKAHHPAEFMAAVISNQGGYYTTLAYLSEARRMGLRILPPDINRSALAYTGKGRTLRVGLMQLKGVHRASLEALLEDRTRRGPFRALEELVQRVDADPADFKVLVKAGCLDCIARGRPRPELLWELLAWEGKKGGRSERGKAKGRQKKEKGRPETKQGETIQGAGLGECAQGWPEGAHRPGANEWVPTESASPLFYGGFQPPRAPPYGPLVRLRHELETLGLLVSGHPLELYGPRLHRLPLVPAAALSEHVGKKVTTAGWFVTGKTVMTLRREPMEFVSFEDTTALYETTFFPRAYERFCHLMGYSRPYLLRGRVVEDYGAISLNVEDVVFLEKHGSFFKGSDDKGILGSELRENGRKQKKKVKAS